MRDLPDGKWRAGNRSCLSHGETVGRASAGAWIDWNEGCGEGECGSCSVLIDGKLVNSCLIPALQAEGTNLTTIEGLAEGPQLHALQTSFLECGGAQCGICTPGMILAACQLLEKKPNPTLDDVREGLSGNLCRCTGYMQIFDAVMEAARRNPA